jgi:two-component system OmpR family response regulator
MNVFVVEDSAVMRQRVVAALEELPGVRVVGWADREGPAIKAVEELLPDLVVLDLWLAEGSGLAVLEAVKRLAAPPHAAVLTNHPDLPYRRRCAELGADFFFDKAEGLDGLLEVCRGVVGVHGGDAER